MEVTVEQMKAVEAAADARGLSYRQMMENAGQAAARELLAQFPAGPHRTAIFCGTGNNGGDGFVMARVLAERCWTVRLILVGGEPRTADARFNREKVKQLPMTQVEALTPDEKRWIVEADAVVDAIYGTGFHGALRPAGREGCSLLNQAAGFCLSLDLPSGVAADTGEAAEGAVEADLTVTFHAAKPCHRLNPRHCGQTKLASIGAEKVL